MSNLFFRKLISISIVIQMILPNVHASTSISTNADETKPVSAEEFRNAYWDMKFTDLKLQNPLWENFLDQLSQSDLSIHIDQDDPVVDQDPFFLRAQSWSGAPQPKSGPAFIKDISNGYFFSKNAESLNIRVPGIQKNLKITAPLTPIQATDDYIILTADQQSTLFEDKTKDLDGENNGQGFFYISTAEMMDAAQKNLPAAIYFFPLPGNGWKGAIESDEIKETNQLMLRNADGESLPIDLADIEQLMKTQQVVRLMATVDTMIAAGDVTDPNVFVYPNPGSTAGFGSIGMNRPTTFAENSKEFLNRAMQMVLPEAKAFDIHMDPKVVIQLMFYAKLLGGLMVGALVLKYTVMKNKLAAIHALEKRSRLPGQKDPGKTNQFFRDLFSVFAHLTTAIQQIGTVTPGIAVELLADRFLPEYAAGEHKMVRKILNNTVLWAKHSSSQIAVNWKTFFLGVVVLGECIDTPFVAVQDLWFFPHFAAFWAPHLPVYFSNKMTEAFLAHQEHARDVLLQGVFRSGVAWTLVGASSYALDSKANMLPRIQKEVDDILLRRGKNPDDPQIQSYRKELVDKKLDVISRQRGLPDRESFMFDINTMFQGMTKRMGYSVDKDVSNTSFYILENRPALAKNAVRKALQAAQDRVNGKPSAENVAVVTLLTKVLRDMNILDFDLIKNPKEKLIRAREVRKTLTLLSAESDLKEVIKEWATEFSPNVAMFAGVLFRKALFSYLSPQGDRLLRTTDAAFGKYLDRADSLIRADYDKENPQVPMDQWVQKQPLEYEYMLDTRVRELQSEEEALVKAQNFKPAEDSWMEKRQKARAVELTIQAIQTDPEAQHEFSFVEFNMLDKVKDTFKTKWQTTYAEALGETLGLYASRADATLLAEAHAKAEKATENQIALTSGLSGYIQKLEPYQKLKFESDLYAVNFFDAYREKTTQYDGVDEAKNGSWKQKMISPDQPGRTQKIRQTAGVRNSVVKTRFFRWVDSFFEDEEYKPGLVPYLKRNIPFANDAVMVSKSFYRTIFTRSTVTFLVLQHMFHLTWPWTTYMWFALVAPWFIQIPSNWLNRFFRQQGMKAMDTVRSKAFYGILYSPATMWATIPFMLWNDDFSHMINTDVVPRLQAMAAAVPDPVLWATGAATLVALSPQVRNFVRRKLKGAESIKVDAAKSDAGKTRNAESFSSVAITCSGLFAR